jgi:hypothetical protein
VDSAYLNRTLSSGSATTQYFWSFWVKRSVLGTVQQLFNAADASTRYDTIYFNSNDTIQVDHSVSSSVFGQLVTTQVFRDTSAWYHIYYLYDSTQATATNRMRLWVNGSEVTTFSSRTNPAQNATLASWMTNASDPQNIGRNARTGTQYSNVYLTEINCGQGTAPAVSSFGETDSATGVWKPKAYTGTYGTNGFYLNFSDNSNTTAATLGKDYSGNGNNWTPNNFSVTAGAGNDSLVDSPTSYGTDTGVGGEVRGNYATWNSLINGDSAANGNLDVTNDTARSTQVLLQFDTYWEITSTGGTTTAGTVSGTGTTNTTTIASTKTYGFRLTTAGTLDYKNITDGGSFTNITTGLTSQQFIYASAAAATTGSLNAGQRPFAATAPSGFKALVTTNLPTPTIGATSTTQANDYFDVTLYTGNNTAGRNITNSGSFQPDFVWIKNRSGTNNHILTDAVRGATKTLFSDSTSAELTVAGALTAFNSNGFQVGYDGTAIVNASANNYVGWQWNAGGSNATNTNGSVTSTVRSNTISGFSIVTFTDPNNSSNYTVGHGCQVNNVATIPSMIIVKERGTSGNWIVWHSSATTTVNQYLFLNDTAGTGTLTNVWGAAVPTSTVFGLRSGTSVSLGDTVVAYCFAPVPGYSAFGSYTGNGAADGPFVYTGFRPAFVMIKNTVSAATSNWIMKDDLRASPFNPTTGNLYANLNFAEDVTATVEIDLLSNGFKARGTYAGINGSTNSIIFMAFAESPFKYSLAR